MKDKTFGASLLVLMAAAGAASAQVAAQAPAQADDQRVEEIVVTAQRRSENLQSVPIAVSAVTAQTLEALGARDVTSLNKLAPGLHIQAATGFVSPRIRGIGTTALGAGLENSVATYVDGVYFASGPGSLLTLNNIAQIDVLKGPQGTLFGRNATGGLLQVTTRDPSQDFGGRAALTYGNYKTLSGEAYVSGGVSQDVAADLALKVTAQGEGYGINRYTGSDVNRNDLDLAVRSKWVWTPSDATKIKLIGDYERRYGNATASGHEAPGRKPLFGPAYVGSPWDINSDVDPKQSLTASGLSLHWDQDLGAVKFSSITAYRRSSYFVRFDTDDTTVPAVTLSNSTLKDLQVSQEFQLQSRDESPVQWVAGVFLFDANGKFAPNTLTFGGPLVGPTSPVEQVITIGGQKTRSAAAYGQATFNLGADTHLTAGLRYTTEKRSIQSVTDGVLIGGVPIGPLGPEITASRRYSKPTWRLALDHQFTNGPLAYLSYNRGFKSGGFNAGIPPDPPFNPEVLDAYEAGLKSQFLDRRVRLNVAAFYYNYSNIQVGRYQNGQIGYYNGASAEIYGLDADLEAHPARGLTITAGLSLIHDRFTDFPNAIFAVPIPVIGGTHAVIASAKGNRLPLTPDATFNLGAHYERQTASGQWSGDINYYLNTGWYGQSDNLIKQGRYDTIDGSLAWRSVDGRLGVRLWGKNLTNEAVLTALGAADISTLVQYEAPRTYGLTLTTEF